VTSVSKSLVWLSLATQSMKDSQNEAIMFRTGGYVPF
jgi:hypothetical protein